jgi:predicted nucleotidyltransferase component of viral defense system
MKTKLPIEDLGLIAETSQFKHIPEIAVIKDYLIVQLLDNLAQSEWGSTVVFKGGTSLSKCYPNSIERFSEDIDLTFNPSEKMTQSTKENNLKKIETSLVKGFLFEPIPHERSPLSKSSWAWLVDPRYRIKVELGASIMAKPYHKKIVRSYLQEYLEFKKDNQLIKRYQLLPIEIWTLDISRTFIDKIMAIKRHAFSGTLPYKVRHIYDVVQLWKHPEIRNFINHQTALKETVKETKENDYVYFEKRNLKSQYDLKGPFDFESWKDLIDGPSNQNYQNLHKDLLFTNQKQKIEEAFIVLNEISRLLKSIKE